MFFQRNENRAGESARREWQARRRRTLRRDWRTWGALVSFLVAMPVGVAFTHGAWQLVFAALFGGTLVLLLVGWEIGGDAHSLSWLWGRVGEQQTEDALKALDRRWQVIHDVPRERGNWDHVVVGPAGIFLLETKAYRARAVVKDDRLYLGRTAINGGALRFSAKSLSGALQNSTSPWVQPVVVIWGDFPQDRHEDTGVIYLTGRSLAAWLGQQPEKLASSRVNELATAVEQLRTSSRRTEPET
jgi:hypothetical protein